MSEPPLKKWAEKKKYSPTYLEHLVTEAYHSAEDSERDLPAKQEKFND